jgi:predicted membrane protein
MPTARVEPTTVVARLVRNASFIAALTMGLALTLFPFLLRQVQATRLHAALPIMLLGIAGLLVYGIGYRPDNRLLRILFGPLCAWALTIGGAWALLAQ